MPAASTTRLSTSRVLGSKPAPVFAVPATSRVASLTMSEKEGPPESEMFDPIYTVVLLVPFCVLLLKLGGIF